MSGINDVAYMRKSSLIFNCKSINSIPMYPRGILVHDNV